MVVVKKWLLVVGLGLVVAGPVLAETSMSATGAGTRKQEVREAVREKVAQVREKVRQTREEFKEKLARIRDEKKRALVERLSERICMINKNRTAAMLRHLETMGKILDRVQARADKAEANGKDVAAVDAAIAAARAAIGEAKAAVQAQAGAACEVTVSGTEGALKGEVQAARTALENGLREVHGKVKAAREAVVVAIKALARVLGEPVPTGIKEAN